MARLTTLKHLFVTAIGISGLVVACRATSPEAPPLAPTPDPNAPAPSPVPSGPNDPGDPMTPGPNFPTEDAGPPLSMRAAREMPIPDLRSERYQLVDAGMVDVGSVGDAMPADSKTYDASASADATLPPPPDAQRKP